MRRALALAALLVALAGCSMQTRYTLRVDVLSFLGEVSGSLAAGPIELYLPDDEDGDPSTPDFDGTPVQAGLGADRLEAARLELTASITNTGAAPLNLSAEVYIGPVDATNLYFGDGTRVGEASITLLPGETAPLELVIELGQGQPGFDLIGTGNFRVGLRLSGSGDGFDYRLEVLELSLTTKRLGELLRP